MPQLVPDLLRVRAGGSDLVLDCTGSQLPRVLYWGEDLGVDLDDDDLRALLTASTAPVGTGQIDIPTPVSVLAEHSAGWFGTPGLEGHRDGSGFSTAFTVTDTRVEARRDGVVAHRVEIRATDEAVSLELRIVIEMLSSGAVRMRGAVTNTGDSVFDLHRLDLNLPVPTEATELLDLTGRHLRERAQQRRRFTHGTHLRESRRARGHDAGLLLAAGPAGFGWRSGEVRALHVAWSGNTRTYAERLNSGASTIAGGELLLAGEVRLEPGATYEGPWLYFVSGQGLDGTAGRFHRYLRSRPHHPSRPRPVLLNVWEAVYFDHGLDRLTVLADLAASTGVERFVLDDGWFGSRRDDTSGLGDWVVSPEVWPHGLAPLIDHVHALGMEFGLWFEPEMVNPDSDVARAHPEWIMAAGERTPLPARHQQVLNLSIPAAYEHVRDQMVALLTEYRIDYIKWDYNRDILEGGTRETGSAAVHEQTLATYALMAELRRRFPDLEIESCAGGGGRIDLGVMEHADRVWASDCIDPLERQLIEAGTSLLLPPELVGSHVASPLSHTTGRAHDLDFRAGNAFFSHLGIEWDITRASPEELARLRGWIELHKKHRSLLHTGTVVHGDHPDPAFRVHGVVAADAGEAIFAVVSVATSDLASPGRVRLPGLAPDDRYEVRPLAPEHEPTYGSVPWWSTGVTMRGAVLGKIGLELPVTFPERQRLIHLRRT